MRVLFQFGGRLFFVDGILFRHLKLELALEITPSNEWEILTYNIQTDILLT